MDPTKMWLLELDSPNAIVFSQVAPDFTISEGRPMSEKNFCTGFFIFHQSYCSDFVRWIVIALGFTAPANQAMWAHSLYLASLWRTWGGPPEGLPWTIPSGGLSRYRIRESLEEVTKINQMLFVHWTDRSLCWISL